jgi:hypothetical protein
VLHLHFELLDADLKPIDPYGIFGITDQYPDPRGKNGKDAGKKNYFLTDPPQPFGAKAKPTDTPSATGGGEGTAPPSGEPTGAGASASPSAQSTPSSSSTPIPSPTATPVPAAGTLPPTQPPPSSDPGPNLVPIVGGVGAVVLVGVVLGLIGLARRNRNPLPRDRWRP